MQLASGISERRVCRAIKQSLSSQRHISSRSVRDESLRERIIDLAMKYGRFGYRQITTLLQAEEWWVNHKKAIPFFVFRVKLKGCDVHDTLAYPSSIISHHNGKGTDVI